MTKSILKRNVKSDLLKTQCNDCALIVRLKHFQCGLALRGSQRREREFKSSPEE